MSDPDEPYAPSVSSRLLALFSLSEVDLTSGLSRAERTASHRQRLLAGVVSAVARSGYAATTLTDIVSAAQVSRRTFYEHFTDKQDCFLAAFDAFNEAMLADLLDAVTSASDWPSRITSAVDAYVGGIFTDLQATRVFNVEVFAAGPAAFLRRRSLHRRWAMMMREEILATRAEIPELAPLIRAITVDQALAIVGGVSDAMQTMVEPDGVPDPAKLRAISLDINISLTLTAADGYLPLLPVPQRRASSRPVG